MSGLDTKPLPEQYANHWNIYGRWCCISHVEVDTPPMYPRYDHPDQCCASHHPETVYLEFKDTDLMALLPEYAQTHQLRAVTGPLDRLGRFYKIILEPKESGRSPG